MDLSSDSPGTEDLILFDSKYKIESEGYRYDTPVIHLFCRNADGEPRHVIVDGFRPTFYVAWSTFAEHYTDLLNDRRVLAIEADLSGLTDAQREAIVRDIQSPSGQHNAAEIDSWTGSRLAQRLSEDHTATMYDSEVFDQLGSAVEESEPLVQIFTKTPGDVGGAKGQMGIRDAIQDNWDSKTWEADIPFERRFLISSGIHRGLRVPDDFDDNGIVHVRYENWDGASSSSGRVQEVEPVDAPVYSAEAADTFTGVEQDDDVRPRILTVDIEVATHGGGVPDPVRARNEITAITAHDSYDDVYKGWFLRSDEWNEDEYTEEQFEKEAEDEIGIDTEIVLWDDETDMLDDFNGWVVDRRFDLITGWNSDAFDYPYLIQRSYEVNSWEVTGWDQLGNPGVWKSEDEYGDDVTYKVDGTLCWDMLDGYKKTLFRDVSSYKLDDVAQEELDYGKAPIEDIDEAWHHDPVDFVVYNTRDTEAVVEIERESGLIELYEHMREVTGADLVDCHTNGPMIDTLFLRKAFEAGIALPTNVKPDVGDFHGAHVFDPVPGVHKNVIYPDLSCFTPDTEVVTPNGIVGIRDLEVGDLVYSIDPETGNVTEKPVIETHSYPEYDGEIVNITTKRANFSVSPNHQMLVESPYSGDRFFTEAGDLNRAYYKFVNEWTYDSDSGIESVDITDMLDNNLYEICASYDTHGHEFRSSLPDGCEKTRANYHYGFFFDGDTFKEHQQDIESLSSETKISGADQYGSTMRPYKLDGDAFIELLGWFITEGNVYRSPDGNYQVKIAQEDTDGREHIERCFERLDLSVSVNDRAFEFGSKVYGELLESLCGSGSHNKQIPDIIFEQASTKQKEELLDVLMMGDGSNGIYYTSSPQLANDVVRLAMEIGRKAVRHEREDRPGEFEVRLYEVEDGFRPDDHVTSSNAEDGVYCVTVADNHTMFAGRNGRFQWIGQSLYPYLIWTLNVSPETYIHDYADLEESSYSDDEVFTVYVDKRGFTMIPKGEEASEAKVDTDQYKGILDQDNDLRDPPGMFTPRYDEAFMVKPNVEEGFIRETVDELVDMKYEYKGEGVIYDAVKRVTNSVWGVLGDSASMGQGFRLFDWRLGEVITLGGRKVIQHTADQYVKLVNEFAKQDGFEPNSYLVGGDTDSCQSSVPMVPDFQTALEWAHKSSEEFLGTPDDPGLYDTFMEDEFDVIIGEDEHRMEVEIESLASKIFFKKDQDESTRDKDVGTKKRYVEHEIWGDSHGWIDTDDAPPKGDYHDAPEDPEGRSVLKTQSGVSFADYDGGVLGGQDPEDNISITGFEYVRSDIAPITAEAQMETFKQLMLSDDYEDGIYTYLEDLVDDVENEKISLEWIGRTQGVGQDLDEYGWKDYDELKADQNYTATNVDKRHGGRYVTTPGPTYRGLKYAIDHFVWQDETTKPVRVYIEDVREGEYPEVYTYSSFPRDDKRPDPPEVGRLVDAVALDEPDRLPEQFVPDYEKMLDKEVKDKVQPILRTVGMDWDSVVGEGRQSGLDQFT